jgi:ABC-2 type transport system permease protein
VHDIRLGFRLQLTLYRSYPDLLIPVVTSPLYAVIIKMVFDNAGRQDLTGYAVLAPIYMSLWWFALFCGGWVIQTDRWQGTIEFLVGSPASLSSVVLGRICAIIGPAFVTTAETWLIGRYLLNADVTVRHWAVFALSFAFTLFALLATALLVASVFVLARSALTFMNSASFPFYLLGGILIPVALLPGWMQPFSKVIFLSWSAAALRASLAPGPVHDFLLDLAMIGVLGGIALASGYGALRLVLHRIRETGQLGVL